MPKSLTLGNGKILVCFDKRGQVRDFYYPHVGLENHVAGYNVHRIGVWLDGRLSWLDDPSWDISVDCDTDTAVGRMRAVHSEFGLILHFTDVIYNEKNIFIREVTVENQTDVKKDIRLYFAQQFVISESRLGDTAYFDPRPHAVIHYKGRRAFLVNARHKKVPFTDYTIGLFNIEGKEGSHVDAYGGKLSRNPIEHGSADSVIGFDFSCEAGSKETVHYWITVGRSIEEVRTLNEYVLKKTPPYLLKTTRDFWHAWVNKQNFSFYGLDESLVDLFKKSLIIIRSHVDDNGAIIASGDSDVLQHGRDTYSYVWPRDSAYAARALDRSGDFNVAHRFFEFCNDVIAPEGYFMHKYRSDKSLGSSWHPWVYHGFPELPIQEDETAIVLYTLWDHYELSKDIEFIELIYNPLIKKAGDFLVGYVSKKTGLPHPSYDQWEEKYGVGTYTCAAVYGGLIAAAKFAELLGKMKTANHYRTTAEKMQKAILKHLYNKERKMFYKRLIPKDGKMTPDPTLDMASFYGVFQFGVLDPLDERMKESVKTIEEQLTNTTEIGGVPRYEGDEYYRVGHDAPPNPWLITTLWLAQYYIAIATSEKELDRVKDMLRWVDTHALSSGVMPEQINPYTGEHLSMAPLTWSHSTYVDTVIDYLEKLEELGICQACNPINR